MRVFRTRKWPIELVFRHYHLKSMKLQNKRYLSNKQFSYKCFKLLHFTRRKVASIKPRCTKKPRNKLNLTLPVQIPHPTWAKATFPTPLGSNDGQMPRICLGREMLNFPPRVDYKLVTQGCSGSTRLNCSSLPTKH